MRTLSLRHVTLFSTLVGLIGCVGGAGDEEAPSRNAGGDSGGAGGDSGGASGSGGNTGTVGGNGAGASPGSAGKPAGGSGGTSSGGTSSDGTASGGASAGSSAGGSSGAGATRDCKRGIGWHGASLGNAEVSSKITWWYTWGVDVQHVGTGLEFVPMVWGGSAKAADVSKNIRTDAQYLLGYNEPNFFEQANLSAQQAAADWATVQSVAQQHQLSTVSPAVNFCGNDADGTGPCHDTNPIRYLQNFFAACQGCKVDYVAVHWYNCDGASLEWYLDQFRQFGRPLWLTEFACAYDGDTSLAGQEKYMREAVPILEGRADVFRYAWFSGDPMPNARLLNADGSFTSLGKLYADLPRDPTCTP